MSSIQCPTQRPIHRGKRLQTVRRLTCQDKGNGGGRGEGSLQISRQYPLLCKSLLLFSLLSHSLTVMHFITLNQCLPFNEDLIFVHFINVMSDGLEFEKLNR